MRTHPLRVLLVDHDEDFLVLWRLLLQDDPRIACVCTATDVDEALLRVARDEVDIVLAEAWMPAGGYELSASVRNRRPGLPVVLTSCADGAGREAISRGAAHYVDKWHTVAAGLVDLLCTVAATAARETVAA